MSGKVIAVRIDGMLSSRSIETISVKTNAEIDPSDHLVEDETVPVDIEMVVELFVGLVRCRVDVSLRNG